MADGDKAISILRLEPAVLAGKERLEVIPPFPMRMDPPGGTTHRECILWDQQLVVLVYESEGSFSLFLDEPYPFDQFIQVLNGRTILIDANGNSEEFGEGDSFVLPKGFIGEWQLLENYRELCVIETVAYESSDELGDPSKF